jgi:flagellar secretion chaperone FliS
MFGRNLNPAASYAQVSIDAKVNSATPHQLILLLFEGASSAITVAKLHIERGEIAQKGKLISQAIDIITNGLKASLNQEVGGKLAEQLAALYDYMARRLLSANIENNIAALDEVSKLLNEIHTAWIEIGPNNPNA